jgi:5-methylcytosine-specific restriction endonuclease McrA
MAKRWYELKYPDGRDVFLEDFGNTLKISGVLVQGMGLSILIPFPQADDIPYPGYKYDGIQGCTVKSLSVDEISELIRQTDDPQYFELDETGNIKAVHRKSRMAISGAVQQKIWKRDGLQCMFCGGKIGDVQLTVDHWVPLELGGENHQGNYLTLCRKENKRKGNMHPKDYCENNKTLFSYAYYTTYLANQPKIR